MVNMECMASPYQPPAKCSHMSHIPPANQSPCWQMQMGDQRIRIQSIPPPLHRIQNTEYHPSIAAAQWAEVPTALLRDSVYSALGQTNRPELAPYLAR